MLSSCTVFIPDFSASVALRWRFPMAESLDRGNQQGREMSLLRKGLLSFSFLLSISTAQVAHTAGYALGKHCMSGFSIFSRELILCSASAQCPTPADEVRIWCWCWKNLKKEYYWHCFNAKLIEIISWIVKITPKKQQQQQEKPIIKSKETNKPSLQIPLNSLENLMLLLQIAERVPWETAGCHRHSKGLQKAICPLPYKGGMTPGSQEIQYAVMLVLGDYPAVRAAAQIICTAFHFSLVETERLIKWL